MKTKNCAIWGILEASSTLKFMMNVSFVPSICIHRSNIIIFIEKSMLVDIFSQRKIFSPAIFQFYFRENPCFCDEFQALSNWCFMDLAEYANSFGQKTLKWAPSSGASCRTTADGRLPSSHWPEDLARSSHWTQKKKKKWILPFGAAVCAVWYDTGH